MADFPDEEQPLVRQALGALVSTHGIKQRLPLDELVRILQSPAEKISSWLNNLTDKSLLQRFDSYPAANAPPQIQYELTHDYLAGRITRWLGKEFWDSQKAREIIRQDLKEWQARSRILARDDIQLLAEQQSFLRLSEAELGMVGCVFRWVGRRVRYEWPTRRPTVQNALVAIAISNVTVSYVTQDITVEWHGRGVNNHSKCAVASRQSVVSAKMVRI